MRFVKLTSHYYLDPAVAAELTDAGEVAFTRSIAYCGAAESGGFIPAPVLPSLMRRYTPARGRKVAAELLAADLWVEVPGGWRLRTWDKQQDELEKLLDRRRKDAERQQRHRAGAKDNGVTASRDLSRDENRDVSRDAFRVRAVARPEVEEEKEQTPPTTSSSDPPATKPGKSSGKATGSRIPDGFEPDADLLAWVRSNAPDVPRSEHARFVDYWLGVPGAKGRKVDWPATWRNWMRRAQEDITAGRRPGAAGRRSTTDERVAQAAALMDVARELDERDAAQQDALVIDLIDRRAIGG